MNYLEGLPEELNYILFTYLHSREIYDLSKILRLHVDYSKLISFEYPSIYKYLKDHINYEEYRIFDNLRLLQFDDDLDKIEKEIIRVEFTWNPKIEIKYIYNLLAQVILETNYNKYYDIILKFPNYEYKYILILIGFNKLSEHSLNIEIFKLINYNLTDIDFDSIYDEIYNLSNYVLIAYILIKYDVMHNQNLLDEYAKSKLYKKLEEDCLRFENYDTSYIVSVIESPTKSYEFILLEYLI
jgi:hypothetical protein